MVEADNGFIEAFAGTEAGPCELIGFAGFDDVGALIMDEIFHAVDIEHKAVV